MRLWYTGLLQLSAKKRYVYGAIAIIWIIIPSIEITFTALVTDIVNGTCVRFPIKNSYAVMKTVGFFAVFISYLLPLTLMVFCYARVILALRSEVILSHNYKVKIHYHLLQNNSLSAQSLFKFSGNILIISLYTNDTYLYRSSYGMRNKIQIMLWVNTNHEIF